jgi:hypothetical protein
MEALMMYQPKFPLPAIVTALMMHGPQMIPPIGADRVLWGSDFPPLRSIRLEAQGHVQKMSGALGSSSAIRAYGLCGCLKKQNLVTINGKTAFCWLMIPVILVDTLTLL